METLTQPLNLFWFCFLLHLIADFNLQGILANMKQKCWWCQQMRDLPPCVHKLDNFDADRYDTDWCAALGCHAIMWSLLTFGIFMFLVSPLAFSAIVLINAAIHANIDHAKANAFLINLEEDQICHLIQIAITVAVVTLLLK